MDILLDILLKPPQPFIGLFFMNKCCGSAQKVFTVLSSLVRIATMLDTKIQVTK